MRELYIQPNSSKETLKTTENLRKKGRKAVRIDDKTIIFVMQDMDEEEARTAYKGRLDKFNTTPTKWDR